MLTEDRGTTVDADVDLEAVRRTLEDELTRRQDIMRDLEPRAIPNVDPVAWATSQATKRVIARIEAALDRVAAGTYGRCIRCGGAIVAGRLEVLPYAETCIDCQNDVENA